MVQCCLQLKILFALWNILWRCRGGHWYQTIWKVNLCFYLCLTVKINFGSVLFWYSPFTQNKLYGSSLVSIVMLALIHDVAYIILSTLHVTMFGWIFTLGSWAGSFFMIHISFSTTNSQWIATVFWWIFTSGSWAGSFFMIHISSSMTNSQWITHIFVCYLYICIPLVLIYSKHYLYAVCFLLTFGT